MEYLKIANVLDNTTDQPFKFRARNQVEINDHTRGTYNTNIQIESKTAMLKSSLYYYSDAYILLKGTITIVKQNEGTKIADRDGK